MKKRITLRGKVQNVGYRLFLLNQASTLGLRGFFAANVGEDLVVAVEGEPEEVEEFLEFVRSERPPGAEVTSIEVEDHEGRVMPRESFASSFSLEQLSKLVSVGVEMRNDIKEMKGDIKEMKGDIKEILEKQDQTIQEIRNLREDLKSFIDARLSKLEEDVAEIKARLGMC